MVTPRSSTLGPSSRPVAVPPNFDAAGNVTVKGRVELPVHVWWSEPSRSFDMDSVRDRKRVCELVLSEGDESDVLHYVRFEDLRAWWTELFLPRHVREAWEMAYPQLTNRL